MCVRTCEPYWDPYFCRQCSILSQAAVLGQWSHAANVKMKLATAPLLQSLPCCTTCRTGIYSSYLEGELTGWLAALESPLKGVENFPFPQPDAYPLTSRLKPQTQLLILNWTHLLIQQFQQLGAWSHSQTLY